MYIKFKDIHNNIYNLPYGSFALKQSSGLFEEDQKIYYTIDLLNGKYEYLLTKEEYDRVSEIIEFFNLHELLPCSGKDMERLYKLNFLNKE